MDVKEKCFDPLVKILMPKFISISDKSDKIKQLNGGTDMLENLFFLDTKIDHKKY
jgi:hypothetical protein